MKPIIGMQVGRICTKNKTNNSPIKKDITEKNETAPLSNLKSATRKSKHEQRGANASHTKVTMKVFFITFEKSEKTQQTNPAKSPKQTKTTTEKIVPVS